MERWINANKLSEWKNMINGMNNKRRQICGPTINSVQSRRGLRVSDGTEPDTPQPLQIQIGGESKHQTRALPQASIHQCYYANFCASFQ